MLSHTRRKNSSDSQSAFCTHSAVCSLHFVLSLHFLSGLYSVVCILGSCLLEMKTQLNGCVTTRIFPWDLASSRLFFFFLSPRRYLFLRFKCTCYSVKRESSVISAQPSEWVFSKKPAKNADRCLKYSNLIQNFLPKKIRTAKEINHRYFSFFFWPQTGIKGDLGRTSKDRKPLSHLISPASK